MKLVWCIECNDLFNLDNHPKTCSCGKCGGRYLGKLNAEYWGKAIPVGFDNVTMALAVKFQPEEGRGSRFDAFIIPKKCPTLKKIRKPKQGNQGREAQGQGSPARKAYGSLDHT